MKPIKKQKQASVISDLKDVDHVIAKISGSWQTTVKISEEKLWDINECKADPLKFAVDPLPSDWRFREDIVWLRRNNLPYAQEWKVRLEYEQRRDRTTRSNFAKKK